jgi:flagellar basal-body rod protein FlgB
MIIRQFEQGSLPAMEAVLRFRMQRHNLLVNNVTNANTPGYRTQDVDVDAFQKMVSKAIEARANGETRGLVLKSTEGFKVDGDKFELQPHSETEGAVPEDKNTVVFDREFSKMLQNGLHVQALQRLVTTTYQNLAQAWRGRSA